MKKRILAVVLMALIFVTGFILRYLYIDAPLWYDEACSWTTAIKSFPSGIMNNLLNDDLQHTPLYFFLLHFWIKIFSQSEISMRVLSLIFSTLSLPLIFMIGKKLFTPKTAAYATAVCSVSPLLVLFSTEVRMYPVVTFLILLSVNFLIDFEQKGELNSLIKMTVTNILIPYTFTGGIFYNFSLLVLYLIYLNQNKKENIRKFIPAQIVEWTALVPFFAMIIHYAKTRSQFIVSHEGTLHFADIVDTLRNFFGATITPNVYWPSGATYTIDAMFTILVIIPCVYFIYGYIKSLKLSDNFKKTLAKIFGLCFIMAIIFSAFKVNIFTARYIVYILPVIFILSIEGITENLKKVHAHLFLIIFISASLIFSIYNAKIIKINKENAFKSPAIECAKIGLNYNDVVIMPFGSDAPYYFKNATDPVIFNADFHKIVRNPNGIYYDKSKQKELTSKNKYKFILEKINEDNIFSDNFYKYFEKNVTNKVSSGRYAVLIMYGSDNNILQPIQNLRQNIRNEEDVKNKTLYTMFSKYMCDIAAMLNMNFNFINSFKKGNFTYYIYQKK